MGYKQEKSDTFANESKFKAVESIHPNISGIQDPLSVFAKILKLNDWLSMHPSTTGIQDPLSVLANESKLNAFSFVQPSTTSIHGLTWLLTDSRFTVANWLKLNANGSIHP